MSDGTRWPALPLASWEESRTSMQLWLQIVGKIQLVSTPLLNHWWNVAYDVSARGLRTRLMRTGDISFEAEFDLFEQQLVLRTTTGALRSVHLRAQSVADFYGSVMHACESLNISTSIAASPNEVAPAIPFAEDTAPRAFDAHGVLTWWQQLVSARDILDRWRAGFVGKGSPPQLFWGSMDLNCARFSGRAAPSWTGTSPPATPAWVMPEAESHENVSSGFWPGGSAEGSFFSYCYPEPAGYRDATLSNGYFDDALGEWLLPYDQVRQSIDPGRTLLTFLNETYALAADLGGWDRRALEIDPLRLSSKFSD